MRAHVAAPQAWHLKTSFEKLRKPADHALTQVKGGAGLVGTASLFKRGKRMIETTSDVKREFRIRGVFSMQR
jgi:hypothetical protein